MELDYRHPTPSSAIELLPPQGIAAFTSTTTVMIRPAVVSVTSAVVNEATGPFVSCPPIPGGPVTEDLLPIVAGAVPIPAVQAEQYPKPMSHAVDKPFVTELKVSVTVVVFTVEVKKEGVPMMLLAQTAVAPASCAE